jgi:hypothetical protein
MPPEDIEIECPKCRTRFKSWTRGSLNLQLDNFSDEYIREVTVKTCPKCKQEINLGCLIVGRDGIWKIG